MKAIKIPNGIIHLAESKAICPLCGCKIPFDKIEDKFQSQDKDYIRMKCECKKFVGITMTMEGDYVAFNLKNLKI
jgi:hypothetical protein